MNLYEFNALSFEDKQSKIWQLGVFLDNYISDKIKINCYALNRFFVEVHYDSKNNRINKIESFKSGKSLDRYSNLKIK